MTHKHTVVSFNYTFIYYIWLHSSQYFTDTSSTPWSWRFLAPPVVVAFVYFVHLTTSQHNHSYKDCNITLLRVINQFNCSWSKCCEFNLPGAVAYITAVSTGTERCCGKLHSLLVSAAESTSTPSSRPSPRHACRDNSKTKSSVTQILEERPSSSHLNMNQTSHNMGEAEMKKSRQQQT